MAFLVTEYGPVDVGCVSQLRRQVARPASFLTTMGGITKAQVGPRTNRVWDLSLPATSSPDEYSRIHAFVEGDYGRGPWGFVSDVARTTNILTPQASLLRSYDGSSSVMTSGPPMNLPDGVLAGSSWVISAGAAPLFPRAPDYEYLPVVAGRPFTASVYVADAPGVRLRVWLYDASGNQVRGLASSRTTTSDERMVLSDVAREGEVSALLIVDNLDAPFRIARPAFTWTEDVQPWSIGEGANSVVVHEADLDVRLAIPGRTIGSTGFTVREVG